MIGRQTTLTRQCVFFVRLEYDGCQLGPAFSRPDDIRLAQTRVVITPLVSVILKYIDEKSLRRKTLSFALSSCRHTTEIKILGVLVLWFVQKISAETTKYPCPLHSDEATSSYRWDLSRHLVPGHLLLNCPTCRADFPLC